MSEFEKNVLDKLYELSAKVNQLHADRFGGASGATAAAPADRERKAIEDYEVRWDPRAWRGPSMKGRKFKDCPVEFLDALAQAYCDMAFKSAATDRAKSESNKKMADGVSDLSRHLNRIGR